jgi:hypothetical protein
VAVGSKSTFSISGLVLSNAGAFPTFSSFIALKVSALLGGFVLIPLFYVTFASSCLSIFPKIELSFPLGFTISSKYTFYLANFPLLFIINSPLLFLTGILGINPLFDSCLAILYNYLVFPLYAAFCAFLARVFSHFLFLTMSFSSLHLSSHNIPLQVYPSHFLVIY